MVHKTVKLTSAKPVHRLCALQRRVPKWKLSKCEVIHVNQGKTGIDQQSGFAEVYCDHLYRVNSGSPCP